MIKQIASHYSSIDLGFANLFCKEKDMPIISKIAKLAYKKNRRFFQNDLNKKFNIIICYSRKELDNEWGEKTQKWLTACANKKRIATFPDELIKKYKKYNKRKDLSLKTNLVHEINHMFYYQIVGREYPAWLLEGLAQYVDGYKLIKKDKKILKQSQPPLLYSCNGKRYWRYAHLFYPMSFLAVSYLIKIHGKRRMLELLDSLKNTNVKKKFEDKFQKTFGYSVNELEKKIFKQVFK